MARQDTQNLYRELRHTHFGSIPTGLHGIDSIYELVKANHAVLCDDMFLCADNCGSGHKRPEWQHAVRRALQAEKSQAGRVSAGPKKRYWLFK